MNPEGTDLPLRDIHLPEPVSWWPPAPGWWLLLGLLLVSLALAWWLRRRFLAGALRRSAKQALNDIAADYRQSGDDRALVQHLSVLLRRLSLSRYPRRQVAGLTGNAWLAWLDRLLPKNEFQEGPGRALIEAPYSSRVSVDGQALLELCERWVRALNAQKGPRP